MSLNPRDFIDVSVDETTGEIRAEVGDQASGYGYCPNAEIWGPDGYIAIPNAKTSGDDTYPDGNAMALVDTGPVARIVASKDNRINVEYGALKEGDRAIVSLSPAKFVLKKENASVNLMTKNVNESDKLMLMQLDGDAGAFVVYVGGDAGTSILKIKSGAIAMSVANGGSLMLDASGFTVTGKWCALNTGGGNLGTIAGNTPPSGANSLLYGVAGPAGAPATFWSVAPA